MTHKELSYFNIGEMQGGNQEILHDFWMRLGGCAAVSACDAAIYCDINKGTRLYPFALNDLTRESYEKFAMIMKPYISPRDRGVSKLYMFTEGFELFLKDTGCSRLYTTEFDGHEDVKDAVNVVVSQIDMGMPIAFLNLHHKDPALKDHVWHWFLLTGYEATVDDSDDGADDANETDGVNGAFIPGSRTIDPDCDEVSGEFKVRITTYGGHAWTDFENLWESGSEEKGGMILFHIRETIEMETEDGVSIVPTGSGNAEGCLKRDGFMKVAYGVKRNNRFLRVQWMWRRFCKLVTSLVKD